MEAEPSRDLTRTIFQLLALGVLIASSFWIVRPFLVALTWAATIAVATWPLMLHVQAWLGGRRSLAVATMTVILLLILVVPLYFGISTIVENSDRIVEWSKSLTTFALPPPPQWVEALPLVGQKFAMAWRGFAASGVPDLARRLSPYGREIVLGFVSQVGSVGLLVVQFLLTVIITAILYANGETAAGAADRFARRLAGAQGENAVHLAAQAVRGVALGVVVTAILQSGAAGIGLAVAGVPFATILTAVMFILCVAQVGPGLIMIPAVFWVYSRSSAVWGTAFLVWAIFCLTFDNLLRPMLIKRGADLPLLLIFTGVIGGLIAFGVIGLFIGPVVLAVAYTLLVDWVSGIDPSQQHGSPPPAPVAPEK
jgi:predicted PurR-regulated permease PerM